MRAAAARTQARRRPPAAKGQLGSQPLPVGGVNALDSFSLMPPTDAIDLINVVVDPYGLAIRNGYQIYAENLPGDADVATLMSFYPAATPQSGVETSLPQYLAPGPPPRSGSVADVQLFGRLFASTNNQIFDITGGGPGPWIPDTGAGPVESSYWTWINFQNAAGAFLLATNWEGAYISLSSAGFDDGFSNGFTTLNSGFSRFTEGPGAAGQVLGVNPDLFTHIMVWKRRLWFVEKSSTRSWYLDPEAIGGQAFLFDWGPLFKHGGELVALANWTIDGGEGIDDYLVAVSSEGDVAIYSGYDPNSVVLDPPAFALKGIWYVGPLPRGKRCVTEAGGNVFILTVDGVVEVSKLVSISNLAPEQLRDTAYKINPLITRLMRAVRTSSGWYIAHIPSDEKQIVGVPQILSSEGPLQLAYHTSQKAWTRYRDVPVATMIQHDGLVFGGGAAGTPANAQGKVFLMFENALDNVRYDGTGGSTIASRIVPAYTPFQTPGVNKRFPMVRPVFLVNYSIAVKLTALTNFQQTEYANIPAVPPITAALWDAALWDASVWVGSGKPIRKWFGTVGEGFAATVQMDVSGYGGTKLMAIDWVYESGGVL